MINARARNTIKNKLISKVNKFKFILCVVADLVCAITAGAVVGWIIDLVGAILTSNAKNGISSIHLALDAGSDPRQIARQIVDYLRTLLLIQMNSTQFSDLNQEFHLISSQQAGIFSQDHLIRTIKSFNTAANMGRLLRG